MKFTPAVIRYPISFWMMFGVAIVTSLLAVAWHGILFIIAVMNVVAILVLPTISRKEVEWQARQETRASGIRPPQATL